MEVNYKSNVKVLYFRERIFEVGRIRAPKHDFTNVIMEVFFILKYIHAWPGSFTISKTPKNLISIFIFLRKQFKAKSWKKGDIEY